MPHGEDLTQFDKRVLEMLEEFPQDNGSCAVVSSPGKKKKSFFYHQGSDKKTNVKRKDKEYFYEPA